MGRSVEKRLLLSSRYTFYFSLEAAKMMHLEKDSAVMFSFSKKDNCAYVWKEEPEEDSFFVRYVDNAHYFSNVNLYNMFAKFFGKDAKKFKVIPSENRYKIVKDEQK